MTLVIIAPLDGWLILLAQGWRFCGDVAEPMPGGHGRYSTMMWKPE